jgi:predicted P-loop ATPase/GTPase
MVGTTAGLDLLKKAKEWFYPDKTINEAEAILRNRLAEDVGSLQEQIRNHRQVIDKLVEQVKADKDMIQKHNEVLIQVSEQAQQAAVGLFRSRILSYAAMVLAGLSVLATICLAILK